eukprot:TRINITY_DN4834_c0_g1_i6.p1 TRINITY_DN4834_c0_g1~~TRINITY_DN4834_c0_g1_i6.p1  ORF type:complete len:330 (-),score=71.87 TRINITY_DN4834_c0_g1_i6:28-1017(-)
MKAAEAHLDQLAAQVRKLQADLAKCQDYQVAKRFCGFRYGTRTVSREHERQAISNQIRNVESQMSTASNKIAQLQQNTTDYRGRIRQFQTDVTILERRTQTTHNEKVMRERSLRTATLKKERQEADRTLVESAINQKKVELAQNLAQQNVAEMDAAQQRRENEGIAQRMESNQRALAQCQGEIREQEGRMVVIQRNIHGYETQLADNREQLVKVNANINARTTEIQQAHVRMDHASDLGRSHHIEVNDNLNQESYHNSRAKQHESLIQTLKTEANEMAAEAQKQMALVEAHRRTQPQTVENQNPTQNPVHQEPQSDRHSSKEKVKDYRI